ncbi:MAG: hypothetical protein LBN22_11760 [Clostridiales Family XIII bacterium]|jgi:cell division protein FtsL|nr:hypothetical protein [Clostridiales Family XIII bacterium]
MAKTNTPQAPATKKTSILKPITDALGKLKSTEKLLLGLLLAIIVISVLVVLVILPMFTTYNRYSEEMVTLQAQLDEKKLEASLAPQYLDSYTESAKLYEETKQKFYQPMSPEDLDTQISNFFISKGFDIESLDFQPIVLEQVGAYQEPTLEVVGVPTIESGDISSGNDSGDGTGDGTENADGSTGAQGSIEGTAAADEAASQEEGSIPVTSEENMAAGTLESYVYNVDVKITGSSAHYYELLNEIKDNPAMRLINAAFAPGNDNGDQSTTRTALSTNLNDNIQGSITVSMKYYVYGQGM